MGAAVKKEPANILYDEVWELARTIVDARKQIGALRPSKLKTKNVSAALLEMDEIVKATEEASNTIMDSAEVMSSADTADAGYSALVQENCSKIFEACVFQDLTGQRVSKVMTTLALVDTHLQDLQNLLGPEFEEPEDEGDEREGDDALLNGPARTDEGISQDDIDALFD
tara:strand:- start:61777 stop:62286 length:510 start_codon:yes stop_codon:yes gene_type:complete